MIGAQQCQSPEEKVKQEKKQVSEINDGSCLYGFQVGSPLLMSARQNPALHKLDSV